MFDLVTEQEFLSYDRKYYNGRFVYYHAVFQAIQNIDFASVLEIGPYKSPILRGSDILDKTSFECHNVGNVIIHDCDIFPYPINNYDLIIALQVLEHFSDKSRSFFEIVSKCKYFIMTLPYMWKTNDGVHNNITRETINMWTLNSVYIKEEIIGNRILRLYDTSLITQGDVK